MDDGRQVMAKAHLTKGELKMHEKVIKSHISYKNYPMKMAGKYDQP